MDKPAPPRVTSSAPGERPRDQRQCPGCTELIHFSTIACPPCWRTVPGGLKAQFGRSAPGSTARARLVNAMRQHLHGRQDESLAAAGVQEDAYVNLRGRQDES